MSASGSLRTSLASLSAYEVHKRLINDYVLCRRGAAAQLKRDTSRDKRDIDVIRQNHRFLWEEDQKPESWEERLTKKYYDKLFKEYCVCDLRRYKENKVAMRWRTENEVVSGRGQFSCASIHCLITDNLRTWEVNFGYHEKGEKKNALVKLRLCPECSDKLNYCHKKHEVVRSKRKRAQRSDSEDKKRKIDTEECDEKDAGDTAQDAADKPQDSEQQSTDESNEGKLWREAAQKLEEKTREEEFQDYLEELLL